VARAVVFPKVRSRLGPRLRALICGSAPLPRETQVFFDLLGIPVLQVYGLTETTAILTMDDPGSAVPGRVGTAVEDSIAAAQDVLHERAAFAAGS